MMTNSFLSFLIPELWKAVGGFGPITIHNVSLLFSIIDSLSKPFERCFPSFWGWRMVAAGTRRVAAVVEYDGLEVDPSEVGP